jgi:MFS family permease
LQALLSREQSFGQGSRTAGIYNMVWAGTTALAYFTSGALLAAFGAETLFWLPAGLHLLALALVPRLEKLAASSPRIEAAHNRDATALPPLTPRPIARSRMFLRLARVANPFAYAGIYGIIPVIPKLSEQFGLTPAYAGLVCSVWFWTRLAGFAWFWRWPGWHYRFGWIGGAFVALIGSFVATLLTTHLWMLIAAQVVFGLSVSLIYYSSLFYAMDVGESKGKRGGFHEAAIGLGIFIGPVAGVSALRMFPQWPDAGIWGISALLVAGLGIFLCVRYRGRK